MASNLDIPQFGTGATPGLNAPRMQAIWTFLKAIGSGGSGSVINSDKVAATTPSAVGLSMLSAADKAAQQALVSLPEVSDSGLVAHWSMDSVPEIPDDQAGVTYLQDKWETVDGWAGNTITPSVSNGIITGYTQGFYKVISGLAVGQTVRIKIRSATPQSTICQTQSGAVIIPSTPIGPEWTVLSGTVTNIGTGLVSIGDISGYTFEVDWVYIGTGAYLPNSLIDNSGNGNHGTIYGATPVQGISGKALAFDGVNDYARASISGLTTKLSLNLYLSDLAYDGGIILESSPNFNGYDGAFILYADTTQNSVICTYHGSGGVGGAYLGGAIAVPSGEFTLSIEIDTSIVTTDAMKVFVNGIQVAISFVNTSTNRVPLYNGEIYMGSRNGTSTFLNGTIDEPRIYNRALTAEEVYSLYMSKGRGPDAQVKSVRGVANSLVVRNSSGQLQDMADSGIGADCKSISGLDLNTVNLTGFYAGNNLIHAPSLISTNFGMLHVMSSSQSATKYLVQKIYPLGGPILCWERILSGTTPLVSTGCDANGWSTIWNSYSDGNGGQPPMAKGVISTVYMEINTPTTVMTLTHDRNKLYAITASVTSVPTADWCASALVLVNNDITNRVVALYNGSYLTITINASGDVIINKTSGGGTTITTTVTLISSAI